MKKPDHCKGCPCYHNAGHKDNSRMGKSKYNSWCCQFSNVAYKVVSICKQQKYRELLIIKNMG